MNSTTFSTRVCACCKREFPSGDFYYNHRTQTFDKYCKECRKKRAGSTGKNAGVMKKAGNILSLRR